MTKHEPETNEDLFYGVECAMENSTPDVTDTGPCFPLFPSGFNPKSRAVNAESNMYGECFLLS